MWWHNVVQQVVALPPPPITLSVRAWSWLVQNAVLPIGDRIYGQRMMQRLQFLRRAQWWGRAELARYRGETLSALIRTAYAEVPFYRRLLDEAGVKPDSVRTPDDLGRIPVVTKAMLRAVYPHDTTRDTGQETYEACSSGSTGTPFCVREDAYTAGWYRAAFLLSLEWLGWPIGAPHVQTGMTLDRSRGRRLKDVVLRCHYVSAYDLTDAHLDEVLEYIDAHHIQFVWGYPGSVYYLALRALHLGWNRPLRGIATWGDTLFAQYRATIEQVFRTRVYDQYGCGEGMMISAQCGHGAHYHVFDTDVIVEYLDDQGEPVPPGVVGNLVVTRLHPGPMPLIRYSVGDLGVYSAHLCECGRGLSIMERIEGRDTDIILTPSGNRLIVHFFTGVLEYFHEIDTFQVVQDRMGAMTLRIVPAPGFGPEVIERAVHQLKEKGADLDIRVELVNTIPLLANGKRRFIVNTMLEQ